MIASLMMKSIERRRDGLEETKSLKTKWAEEEEDEDLSWKMRIYIVRAPAIYSKIMTTMQFFVSL